MPGSCSEQDLEWNCSPLQTMITGNKPGQEADKMVKLAEAENADVILLQARGR